MKSGICSSSPRQPLRRWLSVVLMGLSLMAGAAFADPPGRVGRIADIEGRVWLFDTQANEWVSALRNRPLTAGDRISTDADGRSVLRIGPTSVMVDAQTELEVLQLDDERVSFQLHSGSIALRLRTRETAQEYEVLTREGSFNPERAGHYRVDRRDDVSYASVWVGELRHASGGSEMSLRAGQRAEFFGDSYAQDRLIAPEHDAFADWVMAKEDREQRSVSARYVSPEMTGAEELDRYGRWDESPEYGAVWLPLQVDADWAPYRHGRWVSISPWGWTWVDDAPWGFAPFHYGRWARYRDRWCWVPGSYVQRPVYAPALVGWVGGPQLSVSITLGSRQPPVVGWFPLGPREVYVPSYRASPGYVRGINIHHVREVAVINRAIDERGRAPHESYLNRDVHGAVTAVPVNAMGRGQSVDRIKDQDLIQQLRRGQVQNEPGLALPVASQHQPGAPERGRPERVAPEWRIKQDSRQESGRATPQVPPDPGNRVLRPFDERGQRPAVATQAPAVTPQVQLEREPQREPIRERSRDMGREAPRAFDRPADRERSVPPVAAPTLRAPSPQQDQKPSAQRAEPQRDLGARPAPPESRRADKEDTPKKRDDNRDDKRDGKRRSNLE